MRTRTCKHCECATSRFRRLVSTLYVCVGGWRVSGKATDGSRGTQETGEPGDRLRARFLSPRCPPARLRILAFCRTSSRDAATPPNCRSIKLSFSFTSLVWRGANGSEPRGGEAGTQRLPQAVLNSPLARGVFKLVFSWYYGVVSLQNVVIR